MRTFLLACGLLLAVVGGGVFIGLRASLAGPGISKSDSPAPNDEPQAVEGKAISAAEPKARLYLPGVAVVDLPRLVAAHPWMAGYEEIFADKLTDARSFSDPRTRAAAKRNAEIERDESHKRVVSDIQRIIAAYAATNALTLVLDRCANPLPGRPVVEYTSNTVQLLDITSASGVKDITPAILQLLASEAPNGFHWTQR